MVLIGLGGPPLSCRYLVRLLIATLHGSGLFVKLCKTHKKFIFEGMSRFDCSEFCFATP